MTTTTKEVTRIDAHEVQRIAARAVLSDNARLVLILYAGEESR